MEGLIDGFKLWGPFAVFCVAILVFGWRVLNRREDKLEARINEGFGTLKDSINQLRNDIQQINIRLDANSQAFHADMSKLTEEIEANSHDLRAEIARLNQNHVNHLEHHEEYRQRTEPK